MSTMLLGRSTTAAQKDAPHLRVIPVDRGRWPADPGYRPNHYITVTLDLDRTELAIHADPNCEGPDDNELRRQHGRDRRWPGHWRYRWEFPTPMPRQMLWYIRPYHLTADQAEQLLELIAVQAQVLLAEQTPVPDSDTAGVDWSLAAAAAVRVIDDFTGSSFKALSEDSEYGAPYMVNNPYRLHGLLDLSDAFAAAPELVDPEWAVATDAELNKAAATLAEHVPWDWAKNEQIRRAAHLPDSDVRTCSYSIYAVGVLGALYRYRRDAAGELTVVQAAAWFTQHPSRLAGLILDDTSDVELQRLAAAEERAATHHGHRLVGALEHLTAIRVAQRDRIRQRLRTASVGRAALLLRIDTWNDPADGDDTSRLRTLAELAGVDVQHVHTLRERARIVDTTAH